MSEQFQDDIITTITWVKIKNMIELENKLRQTLTPFLETLKDEESRDFVIQLIMRDVKQELRDSLDALYYGSDLNDPEVHQFYLSLHTDLLEQLK